MLSLVLLELLRDWWRIARPIAWLFTGQPSGALLDSQVMFAKISEELTSNRVCQPLAG